MAGRKQAGDSWGEASRRLAELLYSERLVRARTQEDIAREAGLALSTVRKIESGRRGLQGTTSSIKEPGIFTVLVLLDALDVSPSRLRAVLHPDSSPDGESSSVDQ
ncbi:MAG: helix-turn-helix domain-containing protein [Actinomycetota bacterium]|nr:helix-turn-helix domain-containing protein [Actinomycetota bacterium]